MTVAWVPWAGWLALITFAIQNGFAVLIMRWSKVYAPEPYSSQVAVLMQECAVKLPISTMFYVFECQGALAACRSLIRDLRSHPREWAQLAVPAILYTVQNTLLYIGYANVEAAVGMVTYQSKILWTALFSILVLEKRLSPAQWAALLVLALGVVSVQGNAESGGASRGEHKRHTHSARTAHAGPEQFPALGIAALVGAAVCTSFASVYFEKMIKGASKPSLWLRNIQLALYSSLIAVGGLLLSDDGQLAQRGLMGGFGPAVWASVMWQALGGIVVAVTIKYADNILRGFSQAIALIIGAIGSALLFEFRLTVLFWFGMILVIVAVSTRTGGTSQPSVLSHRSRYARRSSCTVRVRNRRKSCAISSPPLCAQAVRRARRARRTVIPLTTAPSWTIRTIQRERRASLVALWTTWRGVGRGC